ncbi:SDR family oxidoreductase [Lentzea atacamensis]|uniref:SDR family oxidoreductase n=1 Tax=Lentzea atacamensis TaxID=531938 RepID=UPI0014729885|nr:NAD(P)H-binding protein [Lentzea atacamensis]
MLNGADALFLLFAGDLLGPSTDVAGVLDVVKAAGVRRVVLLSSQGAGTRPGLVPHSRMASFEEAVRQSSLEWTILRPSGFFTYTFAWVRPICEHGVAAAPLRTWRCRSSIRRTSRRWRRRTGTRGARMC